MITLLVGHWGLMWGLAALSFQFYHVFGQDLVLTLGAHFYQKVTIKSALK
jgi:hypothetical protein